MFSGNMQLSCKLSMPFYATQHLTLGLLYSILDFQCLYLLCSAELLSRKAFKCIFSTHRPTALHTVSNQTGIFLDSVFF